MVVKLAGSVAAVTVTTLLVWALEPFAPTVSLGVLYIFAVLPVAVAWGTYWSLPVAVASMLAFNFFFLPPTHTFTLRDSANWFALAVYSVTALVVSELASRSRRRAADAEQRERESSLLAEIAGHLLGGRPWTASWAGWGFRRRACSASRARRSSSVRLAGSSGRTDPARGGGTDRWNALRARRRRPGSGGPPAVPSGVGGAARGGVRRSRLEQEALEAEALRRSDLVKTALLRAVSHDLRSPLTGITTAIGALRSETLVFSDDDRRVLLDTIAVDAERLGRLVGDLLDLSRLEAGGAEPEAEVWALDDLVRDAVHDVTGNERVEVGGESPAGQRRSRSRSGAWSRIWSRTR